MSDEVVRLVTRRLSLVIRQRLSGERLVSGSLKIEATPKDEIAEQGERIYEERLKADLESRHTGRFVAIETGTGSYFLGDTGAQALISARSAMPDKLFYLIRIGQKSAHTIGGHGLRTG